MKIKLNLKNYFSFFATRSLLVILSFSLIFPIYSTAQMLYCGNDESLIDQADLPTQPDEGDDPQTQPCVDCSPLNCVNNGISIPLAFHFDDSFNETDMCCIYQKVQEQIDVLNTAFGDNSQSSLIGGCPDAYNDENGNSVVSTGTCISFYLAKPFDTSVDANRLPITIGEFTGGHEIHFWNESETFIIGGSGAGVDWDDYLNVFVKDTVKTLNRSTIPASLKDDVIGKSDQQPGSIHDMPGEGVTIRGSAFGGLGAACGAFDSYSEFSAPHNYTWDFTGGMILAHEIGHYLGLAHLGDSLFGDCIHLDKDNPDLTFNNLSTKICDTPAQSQREALFDCNNQLAGSGGTCENPIQKANIMNYNSDADKGIFTQDQACVMNLVANVIFGALPVQPVDLNTFDITSDVTWETDDKIVFRDIIVRSGNTLKIDGITVRVMGEHTIYVEEGAKLILENATLTVGCNNYWNGIILYGDASFSQPTTVTDAGNYPNHGVLITRANSKLEHSKKAIETHPRKGVFRITQTSFENNIVSVSLNGSGPNIVNDIPIETESTLVSSYFRINNNFHNTFDNGSQAEPDAQIYMSLTNGFYMSQLSLLHSNTLGLATGSGILAYDAGYTLRKSTIKKFKRGIDQYNNTMSSIGGTYIRDDNKFYDNVIAASFSGLEDELIIKDNIIEVLDQNTNSTELGIQIDGCANYKISRNVFREGNLGDFTSAIWATNSGSDQANYIYNNYFGEPGKVSEFQNGIFAFNTNPSLQILCNFFTDASMLHGVTLLNGTTGVIAPFQGNCILNADVDIPEYFPTGNRLADSYQSFPGQSDHRHFASFSTEPIVYNHFPGETPEFLPNNITANECDLQDVEKDCSLPDLTPQVTNSCNTDFFKSHVLELEKRITQQSTLLVAYGRDDQSETIRSSGTVKQLKQKIDGFELYLSNNELIAVVEKIGVFEEISDIFNILLDNAPLQYTVREFLAEHINKLPVKIRLQLREQTKTVNQLLTIPTGLSLAQEVEAEVIKYLEDQKYIEPLLQSCLASRVQHEIIEVIKNLADNVSLNKNFFKRKAVEYQIDAALYDDARLSLKTIDSNGDDELKAYKQLKEIEINLKQQNRNATELTSKERTNLKNIAGLNTRSAIQARNALLHFHDSTTVFIPPVLPKDTEWRKPSLVQSSIYSELTDVINPNPATDQIQFNLPLVTGQFNTFKIKVFNGNGQLVKEMEDYSNGNTSYSVRELREGVYIVEISNNELNLRLKDKLIIIR